MKKIIAVFISLFLILSACDNFLDINENPNYPKDVSDELLLTSAIASTANVYAADYGLLGSFWSQHWAQNNTSSQYKIYESYSLSSNTNVIDRSYRELYEGALSDNEIFLRKVIENENWGAYLMGATIKAFDFQYLVDLYDNVPYSESFMGLENLNPVINSGEEVYQAIYTLLNDALDKDVSGFIPDNYLSNDIIFGAELSDWRKFANTVKLRLLLRQYDANESFATSELTSLLASADFLSKDVAIRNFEDDVDSKTNPLYESDQKQLNTKNNIRACATFTSYLETNNDTRLQALFDEVAGNYYGMIPGSYNVPSTEFEAPDIISKPKITPTMPVYLMTVAESELLQAEAYLRLGDAVSAQQHYESGVESSFTRMGAEIGDLLTTVYAFPATNFEDQLKAIIMQKWVDAADGGRGMESHIERVRTGYPEETTVNSAIEVGYLLPESYIPGTLIYSKKGTTGGILPRRLPYPDSELNFNSNATEYKALTDSEVILQKVWWNL